MCVASYRFLPGPGGRCTQEFVNSLIIMKSTKGLFRKLVNKSQKIWFRGHGYNIVTYSSCPYDHVHLYSKTTWSHPNCGFTILRDYIHDQFKDHIFLTQVQSGFTIICIHIYCGELQHLK